MTTPANQMRPVAPAIDPLPAAAPAPARLASLDALRGFVMFLVMAEVLQLSCVAAALPASPVWQFFAYHQAHVPWTGCSLHDLIQPCFSFLVGVALPFSLANRAARGQSRRRMTLHACVRALVLVLLGVLLRSIAQLGVNWTFEDTLSQIGLGYVALFLLGFRPAREQWAAFGLILLGYWAAFALYPLPGHGFDYANVGESNTWPHLMSGFAAHWNKNSNPAWAFDTWFLNLFPRDKPFMFHRGGYATLSFIPTLATMILGLVAGQVVRSPRQPWARVKWLAAAGVIGLAAGAALDWLGLCPIVKRIWTPSWVLYSGGWCFLLLSAFYVVIDIWGFRRWAFPLLVLGMNSIAAYCMAHVSVNFIGTSLNIHSQTPLFLLFGQAYHPLLHGLLLLLLMWLVLYLMHRRKLFLRI